MTIVAMVVQFRITGFHLLLVNGVFLYDFDICDFVYPFVEFCIRPVLMCRFLSPQANKSQAYSVSHVRGYSGADMS